MVVVLLELVVAVAGLAEESGPTAAPPVVPTAAVEALELLATAPTTFPSLG